MAGKRAVPDHLANFSILKYRPQVASFALATGSPQPVAAKSQMQVSWRDTTMPVAMIARFVSSGLFRSLVAVLCCCDCALAQTQASHCKGPAELERAIAAHPSAAAYDALGAYFGQQNQLSCALSAFRSAVHLAPGSWEAHYDLAIAFLQQGAAQQAVRELRTASGLKPGTPQIDLALGVALSQSNQPAAAIDSFKAVLKIDPKSIPALDGLTKALIAEN